MRSFLFVVGVQRRVASNKPRLIIIPRGRVAVGVLRRDHDGDGRAAETPDSQGKPVTASSTKFGATPPAAAVDGDTGSRWSSGFSDPNGFRVDLGAVATYSRVVLRWEAAHATAYRSRPPSMAEPGQTWTAPRPPAAAPILSANGKGRYVRMRHRRATVRVSLWEVEISVRAEADGCDATSNAALNRPATASSVDNGGDWAAQAFEAGPAPAGRAEFADPHGSRSISGPASSSVRCLVWETADAKAYQIQVSTDAITWGSISTTTAAAGGTETLRCPAPGATCGSTDRPGDSVGLLATGAHRTDPWQLSSAPRPQRRRRHRPPRPRRRPRRRVRPRRRTRAGTFSFRTGSRPRVLLAGRRELPPLRAEPGLRRHQNTRWATSSTTGSVTRLDLRRPRGHCERPSGGSSMGGGVRQGVPDPSLR